MKRFMLMTSLAVLMAVGLSAKAQDVTITLIPGWTWISYPYTEVMDIETVLGDFVPMQGDIIKSQFSQTVYINGRWMGGLRQFTPGIGYKYYSNRTEDVEFVFAQAANSVVTTATPTDITGTSAMVGGTVTVPEGGHVFLRGVCWGTEPNPDIDGNHTSNGMGIGDFNDTIVGLSPSTTYYVRAYAVTDHGLAYGENLSFVAGNEYVDLGLPSGTLWATCNVGADTPEGYGDYFAWGETQPKSTYAWSTYQYCNGSDHTLTKYCNNSSYGYNGFTDNLITLLPEDDAATANWGEDWRMASREEWRELYNNTTYRWTTQNGVNGRLFTAANGNSLFLPAAGYRGFSGLSYPGSGGAYWMSSFQTDSPNCAWDVYFSSGDYVLYYGRSCGQSVRAVRCKNSVIEVSAASTDCGEVSGGGTYMDRTNCTVSATANEGYSFICWSENGETVSTEATYTFIVSGNRSLVAYFYNYTSGAYTYIDLGLPSGLLWATCNVGADTPEAYGDYFAWGETQPKSVYNWDTYQYCNLPDYPYEFTKYCNYANYGYNGFTDNLTILLPEDDAATANWGDDWRMPTKEEWQELMDNTISTLTTINGNNGRLFIATNGNGLFLPAAGYRDDSSLVNAGHGGLYWSSSLKDFTLSAWRFEFGSVYDDMGSLRRLLGLSVRAVRSGSQNASFNINTTTHPTDGGTVTGDGTYQQGQNCTLTATANAGYYFVNWTENGEVVSTDVTYTFTVQADRTLVANFTYICEYVDLGLPSGLLWATCNVGATVPEEYGDYFAWGETQPKDYYDWSTYQYGGYYSLTKYCNNSSYGYNGFTDNLTTLLPEDDAATANWGSDWRMPTWEEWLELSSNTTCTWTVQNGVDGRLFTASNGNSLFLPAASYLRYDELYDDVVCLYWSSSLLTDYPNIAWYFDPHSLDYFDGRRCYGQSVRAVRSSEQN